MKIKLTPDSILFPFQLSSHSNKGDVSETCIRITGIRIQEIIAENQTVRTHFRIHMPTRGLHRGICISGQLFLVLELLNGEDQTVKAMVIIVFGVLSDRLI